MGKQAIAFQEEKYLHSLFKERLLVVSWLTLLSIGLVMVASASIYRDESFVIKHTIHLIVALVLFLLNQLIPLSFWKMCYQLALFLLFVLLVAVLVPGIGHEVNGSQRWIRFSGVSLQVSELAKLLMLFFLAAYFEKHREALQVSFRPIVQPVIAFVLAAALLLFQPDFGTVIVLAVLMFGLLFISGIQIRYVFCCLILAPLLLLLLIITQPYRLNRLKSFMDPWSDPLGVSYQLIQSLIAFGQGHWFGAGLGNSIQKLSYLPEAHNDFIFAILAEELGLLGCLGVLVLFLCLILRIFRIAYASILSGQIYNGTLVYGVGFLFSTQFLINVGVNLGMLPTKGLTLPFVSYGGSSLLVSSVMLGLVMRAYIELNQSANAHFSVKR